MRKILIKRIILTVVLLLSLTNLSTSEIPEVPKTLIPNNPNVIRTVTLDNIWGFTAIQLPHHDKDDSYKMAFSIFDMNHQFINDPTLFFVWKFGQTSDLKYGELNGSLIIKDYLNPGNYKVTLVVIDTKSKDEVKGVFIKETYVRVVQVGNKPQFVLHQQ